MNANNGAGNVHGAAMYIAGTSPKLVAAQAIIILIIGANINGIISIGFNTEEYE